MTTSAPWAAAAVKSLSNKGRVKKKIVEFSTMRLRLTHGNLKASSRQGQGKFMARSRRGLGKVKARSRQGPEASSTTVIASMSIR